MQRGSCAPAEGSPAFKSGSAFAQAWDQMWTRWQSTGRLRACGGRSRSPTPLYEMRNFSRFLIKVSLAICLSQNIGNLG